MIRAAAEDFLQVLNVEVLTSRDARLGELHPPGCRVTVIGSQAAEENWLADCSAAADWTLLIAPETGGALARCCRLVESMGGRLLSPTAAVVELATDKQATAELLADRGVPVPRGWVLRQQADIAQQDFRFPAAIKPLDGCGSQDVLLLKNRGELRELAIDRPMRLEEFVSGQAASAAVLCGPRGVWVLPPCEQHLSRDGRFTYRGGGLPMATELAARAQRLAEAAVKALPQPRGYIGVDMVLGAAADGSGDRVIEINPRLTTSYVGLRALASSNLAAAMLAAAEGLAPDLRFGSERIEFLADGAISSRRG